MSFINNKRNNIISAKITEIGRKKIALGNLNYAKWAVGDSEINYSRELLSGGDIAPKILLPADLQPDLKYFVSDDPEMLTITKDIVAGDINLVKLSSNNLAATRGFLNQIGVEQAELNLDLIKKVVRIDVSDINHRVISINNANQLSVGDIMVLEVRNATHNSVNNGENLGVFQQAIFFIEEINGSDVKFNRQIPKPAGVDELNAFFIDGRDVLDVPSWNFDETLDWSAEVMSYDFNPTALNQNKRPLSFNVVTLERLAGYFDQTATYGERFLGIIENYLSYNDDLNSEPKDFTPTCSDSLVMGEEDKFKKLVGIVHFENGHHNTTYGESFYNKAANTLQLNLPYVKHPSATKLGLTLVNDPNLEVKTIMDSDIKYLDLVIKDTTIVVGKILEQFKMVIIDDSEIVTAMSVGSGRNYTLPMIEGKLVTSENGLLSNGKQIYVTYRLTDPTNEIGTETVHCNKYLLIKNDTVNAKDVELKFRNIDDFVHMLNPNVNDESGFTATSFEIIYQITNINERPTYDNWVVADFTSGNAYRHTASNKDVINPIGLTNKTFLLDKNLKAGNYDITYISSEFGIIGDDKVLFGNFSTYVSSITYKSLIQIRLNTNQYVYSSNPTRVNDTDPVIVSEIGIYDNDDDLVMIGKLSNPIELSTKSNILIELSMDF